MVRRTKTKKVKQYVFIAKLYYSIKNKILILDEDASILQICPENFRIVTEVKEIIKSRNPKYKLYQGKNGKKYRKYANGNIYERDD